MEKILLCIGCNNYPYIGHLRTAELDAETIFQVLTSTHLSHIPPDNATLLLSPATSNFREALEKIHDSYESIESLTIYFAGHGGVSNGSYYLCFSDTRHERLSTTGLAISHLFEFLNEIKAAHCNLIIDACQASGMISDMSTLLKPEIIGKARSCGISIFVSSAADQAASENSAGGYGTTAILQVLRGEIDTGSRTPALDLLDIGRAVSQHVARFTEGGQLPSIWGMNLYGQMPLYGNPHASNPHSSSFKQITGFSPTSAAGLLIGEKSSDLFGLMFLPATEITPEKIFNTLFDHIKRLEGMPEAAAALVTGVWSALKHTTKKSTNTFAHIEITATCISLLLQQASHDPNSANSIQNLAIELCHEIEPILEFLSNSLDSDPEALNRHGIPDLFYLPQRVSRILGWCGASLYIANQYGLETANLEKLFTKISYQILDTYAASAAGISETETPFWLLFIISSAHIGNNNLCEQIIGSLYNSLIENEGSLARTDLESKDVLNYLQARATNESETRQRLSNHPSEILSLTLLASKILSLQDVIDVDLEKIDHAHLSIFIPDDYSDFSLPCINNGRNHVFQIGHGIWRVEDLVARWHSACAPQIMQNASLAMTAVRVGAVCSSLIFPDRTPWFLFANTSLDYSPNK
ncbi:caspase family protein [Aquipseudomonas alcaligenes]